MRWTAPKQPQKGDTRQRTFFAFLPFSIGEDVRWLESVTIVEVYRPELLIYSCEWTPIRFVEDIEPQTVIPQ